MSALNFLNLTNCGVVVADIFIRWEGGTELGNGHTLEFVFRFPTAELRPFPLSRSDLVSKVVWLVPAPEGQVLEVLLLYVPSGRKCALKLTVERSLFVWVGWPTTVK